MRLPENESKPHWSYSHQFELIATAKEWGLLPEQLRGLPVEQRNEILAYERVKGQMARWEGHYAETEAKRQANKPKNSVRRRR